ncbi:metallophosphoesterase [Asticcacaulis sp. AC402]|uniref:metallophosphoesterase n=1 Tax=Asticcacaulis sp. AC402 TaxID=1282361 RepID=UPI0003C3B9F9|nr:metallophosphoesterase [Asticcacaulis sp. AC402]ESQ73985.1 phosphoesterase [Asticcacaulis sp. AC402]
MNYDIIGDIHGHAVPLTALLTKLGYRQSAGAWRHPDRIAIFVGDFVDRGPGQLEGLRTVRAMIDAGSAQAVMGNHEFNAIAWSLPDPDEDGGYLRPRNAKNRNQHRAFLEQIGEDSAEHRAWTNWFLDLPLWIETPAFRVVHACWHAPSAAELLPQLKPGLKLDHDLVLQASRRGSKPYAAIETLLKGREVRLPPDVSFRDKDGNERHEVRIKWWAGEARTYRDAAMGTGDAVIPDIAITGLDSVNAPDRLTFIGHYWLNADHGIGPLSPKVACVDYSVARGGPLVAYRFDGEAEVEPAKFVAAYGDG